MYLLIIAFDRGFISLPGVVEWDLHPSGQILAGLYIDDAARHWHRAVSKPEVETDSVSEVWEAAGHTYHTSRVSSRLGSGVECD